MRQFLTLDTLNQHNDLPQSIKDTVLSLVKEGEAYIKELVWYYTDGQGSFPVEIRGLLNPPSINFWLEHHHDYANDGETQVPGWQLWGGMIWHLCEKPSPDAKVYDRTQTKLNDVWNGHARDCIVYKGEIRWRASDGRMRRDIFPSLYFGSNMDKPDGKTQTRVWYSPCGGLKANTTTLRDMIILIDQWLEVERITNRIQRVCCVDY